MKMKIICKAVTALKIKEFDWSYIDLNVYGDTQDEILVKNETIYFPRNFA